MHPLPHGESSQLRALEAAPVFSRGGETPVLLCLLSLASAEAGGLTWDVLGLDIPLGKELRAWTSPSKWH